MEIPNNSVKLGLMPPLTGLVGIYGTEIARAGLIACQDVNENGGVLGRPLELIIEDDGSLPESAVAAAEKLVGQDRCSAIIGNLLSNSRIAVAYSVAEPHKVPFLNFSFYEGSIVSRYFFHFAALPNQQIDRMIPFMRSKFGPRMFFAGNNYEWPRGSIHAGKLALQGVGGIVVGEEYCPIGVSPNEIESLLDQVEASAPDVFVPYFAGADQLALLTRFTERGLKTRMAVVMGHYDEMMASNLSPEIREGFYSSNTYFMTVDTPGNHEFLSRLAKFSGVTGVWPHGNGILTNFGEGAYVCVKAFAEAANRAGSIEAEALIGALENIRLETPQGVVEMNPSHHHASVNTYLSRCNADGVFNIVEEFGANDPILPERYRHQAIDQNISLEEEFRLQARILEMMSEAVFLVRTNDDSIVYANTSAESMFGDGSRKLLGMQASEIFRDYENEGHEFVDNIFSTLVRKGGWQGEIHRTGEDLSTHSYSLSISAFTHPFYGEAWLFVVRDITQRKQAEKESRESEARFAGILDIANQAVISLNEHHRIELFNKGAESIFGYGAEEVLGQPVEIFLPAEFRDVHLKFVEEFAAGPDMGRTMSERGEVVGQRKDGTIFPAEASISKLKMGERTILTIMLNDITQRHETEQQLRQAQKMEAVGQLTGGIAHDFNNFLTVVMGNLELLSERVTNDEIALNYADRALTGAQRSAELTHRLLAFSRKQALVPSLIDIRELANGLTDLMRRTLGETIEIEVLNSDDLWLCEADSAQLESTILNLAINARDAMPKGGKLTIETDNVDLMDDYAAVQADVIPGQYVMIAITDTGTGMPPEILNKVFEPFYTTKELGQGSGLGLSMVYGFIKQSKGQVTIYSEEGVGTTIKLYLPKSDHGISDSPPEKQIHPPGGSGETILVVEDDPDVRTLSVALLSDLGYEILEAENSKGALRALENSPRINMLFTDVILPGEMNGFELAEEIRLTCPGIAVLFTSGYTEEAFVHQGRIGDNIKILNKPFQKADLARMTRAALDQSKSTQAT